MEEVPRVAERNHRRADQELVRALAHPVRVEILQALQGRVASPAELSREIDQRLGVVSYHASTLLRCGCLELVHSRGRRGGLENFYRRTAGPVAGSGTLGAA
jgi:DNA-binding transcriptional ArsR family regulator